MKSPHKRDINAVAEGDWSRLLPSYERLIGDESRDSWYLRSAGLQRNMLDLLGDTSDARVLDVGCGTGWLLDNLRPKEGYECDCVPRPKKPGRPFSVEDVRILSYSADFFDVVVASLVLMWIEELDQACRELHRVTSVGGRVLIALVHPFSYRTGTVTDAGDFLVTRRYSEPFMLPDLYIGEQVGPFRYFHRPLSQYINAFASAGFVLNEMREWSVDMSDYAKHVPPNANHPRRTDRMPMYVFFDLRKAG